MSWLRALGLSGLLWLSACGGGSGGADSSATPEPTAPAPVDPAPSDPLPEPVPTDPAPTEPVPTDPVPGDPAPTLTGYRTDGPRILDEAGNEVQLRGINMYGFNANILIPQYLWTMGWKEQIQQVKDLGFNAVRLPYIPKTLYSTMRVGVDLPTWVEPTLNADLQGKTPLEVLDLWMAEAERQGLYVLMDFHGNSHVNQYMTWYNDDPMAYAPGKWAETWNGEAYSTADWMRDLVFVARRYAHLPHFIGIDVYNEPNGVTRWGPGDVWAYAEKSDWKLAVEQASAAILDANPRLLIFVQGIVQNWDGVEDSSLEMNWGENFQPQAYKPLAIPTGKLVLTPHTYGPDALYEYPKRSFSAPDFPANLEADWERLFGQFSEQYPVVLGEFGGFYGTGPSGQADRIWQDALVDYLIEKNLRSAFYWTYTPNSYNTGGILADDLTVRQDKMALLHRLFGN